MSHPVSSFINLIMLPSLPITLGTLFGLILKISPSSILPNPLILRVRSTPLLLTPIIFATTMSPISITSSSSFLLTNLGTSIKDMKAPSAHPMSTTHPLKVIFSTFPITTFPLLGR